MIRLNEHDGPSFDVYRSEIDGTWVVHIDTGELDCNTEGPFPLRVYINDGDAIYENPSLQTEDDS